MAVGTTRMEVTFAAEGSEIALVGSTAGAEEETSMVWMTRSEEEVSVGSTTADEETSTTLMGTELLTAS